MKTLLAVGFATLYALGIRLLFGISNGLLEIMTLAFLAIAPMVIGFLTVYFIKTLRSYAAAFFLPWATSAAILFFTIILNMEGTICWIMIYPFFAIAAGLGGIFALYLNEKKRARENPGPPNYWNLSWILCLPAVFGIIEGQRTLSHRDMTISESVVIAASPEEVWKQLTNINDIPENSGETSFAEMMGFPKHLNTTLDSLTLGGKRTATYEHGLYFDETIAQYENNKLMVLDIHTDPSKIPPTVMDEHILIGGKHCDIEQDTYMLEQLEDGTTRLTLTSKFWINTPFNWYSGWWAKYLMSDILRGEIELIKSRAEKN
jgi:hypothetical protein